VSAANVAVNVPSLTTTSPAGGNVALASETFEPAVYPAVSVPLMV